MRYRTTGRQGNYRLRELMSNYIVLVKQVPDVTQITDNAFDTESGTLIRSRLASVINELDTQALAFADRMRHLSNDKEGRIIALTMGPPTAEEVLRYSLSRCADTAVLLTDSRLGGADTVATANPLAYTIRKIAGKMLGNSSDYYIICGMQSVDGDTAQVPPQIAEELSLPCIAYVTGAEYRDNRFEFVRIISGGSEVVAAKKLPAVITVAKYEYPLFATFCGSRRAGKAEIVRWDSDDIKATYTGVKGSKTSVIRVFPPGKGTRKCERIGDVKTLAEVIISSFKSDEKAHPGSEESARYILPGRRTDKLDRSFEGTKKEIEDYKILSETLKKLGISKVSRIDRYVREKVLAEASERFHSKALEDMLTGLELTEAGFSGEVWVVAEHSKGVIHPATFELIGKGRELADCLETKVGVVAAGESVEAMAGDLIAAGADNIYIIEDRLLSGFEPSVYRKAVADCVGTYRPQIVLFAATPQGRILAPMVSYRLGCGLTADCTGLDIKDSSRKGQVGILFQTRPALGGNVMATICSKNSVSQMATARPGVMKRLHADRRRTGKIVRHKVNLTNDDVGLEIIKTEPGGGQVDFEADVIVSGGKGMQSRDNYERLVSSLRDCLVEKLGTKVEKGASRAAVEQGFIERAHQVGQTGTAVGPKLYIALGISGAIQHMIGVANAGTIIAINSDPNAPIFRQCDYYVAGTVEETVPELVKAVKLLQMR